MRKKVIPFILLPVLIAVGLSGCYGRKYFVRKLDKQFGEGSYTMKQHKTNEDRFIVTLKDYPEHPFHVGSGIDGLPYKYSTFQQVFRKAIYDDYAKKKDTKQSVYKLERDSVSRGDFWFELQQTLNLKGAEKIYDEMTKIISVIKEKYPVYNTKDYLIGIQRQTYKEGYTELPFVLASCQNGSLRISSKENFLAYERLMEEKPRTSESKGVTISNQRGSSITLGVDTLRLITIKGFHIDGLSEYSSLQTTKIAPGAKGTSAWCEISHSIDYRGKQLGFDGSKESRPERKNYVYVETRNLGEKPCALKDTKVTKVVYHFYDTEDATSDGQCRLYLDGMHGDITRGDSGFDLPTNWELGKPKTKEEKEKGIRHKDVLVKIQVNKLGHNSFLDKLTDTPVTIKGMDIIITWDPQKDTKE